MTPPRFRWRMLHATLFLAAAITLWLFPFFKAGWKGAAYRDFPRAVRFQYNAAGLFTRRSTMWWDHHLERDGRAEVPERAHFPMGAFGYRTRLDRILNESQRSGMREGIRRRMAEHVVVGEKERRKEGENESMGGGKNALSGRSGQGLQEIRIVRSLWRVGEPILARPVGAWNPPPVTELPANRRQVLGAWRVEADGSLLALREELRGRGTARTSEPRVVRRVRASGSEEARRLRGNRETRRRVPSRLRRKPSTEEKEGRSVIRAARPVRVVRPGTE